MKKLLLIAALAACSHSAPAPTPVAAPSPSRVAHAKFHSDALGVDKAVVVYLPAGYESSPQKRWPVYYYLHGLTGNEENWVEGMYLDKQADAAHLGAIVVMPDGDDDFYVDSDMPIDYDKCMATGEGLLDPREPHERQCVRARKYETYIAKDLVGWVDATYRTIAERRGRGIAGLSMGGFGALQLGLRHQDLFAAAASHSGVVSLLYKDPHPYVSGKVELVTHVEKWGESMGALGAWFRGLFGASLEHWQSIDPSYLVTKLPAGKYAPERLAIYLDCGTEDDFGLFDAARYVDDLLTKQGIEHEYYLGPGKHDDKFWSERLPHSLAFMQAHVDAVR